MPYVVLFFVTRKAGMSPADFKNHFETSHIPLMQSLTGPHFPRTHVRRYIQQTDGSPSSTDLDVGYANYPAIVLVGTEADFEFDAFAELVFEDKAASDKFFELINAKEALETRVKEEEMFLDRSKIKAIVVGDVITTAEIAGTTGPAVTESA